MTAALVDADDLRFAVIKETAKARADLELRETRAVFLALYGKQGEQYLEEVRHDDRINRAMRNEPPPKDPPAIDPVKRSRWARSLRSK